MVRRLISFTAAVSLLLLFAAPALAELKLPAIIGDNMALQAGKPAAIWGWASPGDKVAVSIDGDSKSAVADKDGLWRLELAPHAPGGPFELSVVGEKTIKIKNVVFGQVWICSGQSNMEFSLASARDGEKEVTAADHPDLRLFKVTRAAAEAPLEDLRGGWVVCSPATAGRFSAVGYFFGRQLNESLHQPIGLIDSSWGGTTIQLWMSPAAISGDAEHGTFEKQAAKADAKYQAAKADYDKALPEWEQRVKDAKTASQPAPPPLPQPSPPMNPSMLYNGMIHPLAPMTLAGWTWYQGESNASAPAQYGRLLVEMIADWRKTFGQGDLPFLIVQLPNYLAREKDPSESKWAEVRQVQAAAAAADPHVGLAVTIDLGEAQNIHPKDKQDVGQRLALVALKKVYNQDIVASGPTFASMKIEEDKVRVQFDEAGGLITSDGQPVTGFAIAGDDKKFFWANAVIDGQDVVLSSDKVSKPVAVRYAWASNPACNLCNQSGLPAVPFRTDNWSTNTVKAK